MADSYRAVLEVLKYTDAWTALSASSVCRRWCTAASAEELWSDLLSDQPPLCPSSKATYALFAAQRDARFCLITSEPQAVVYDCVDNLERYRITLQRSLPEWCSAALISTTQMLVCGGQGRDAWIVSLLDGAFRAAPPMWQERSGHAAIYVQRIVYVFGGDPKQAERTAERFSLSSDSWAALPAMSHPRKVFNPCRKSSLIYLCGGVKTKVCETFDITTEQYRVIARELASPYQCVACFHEDTLVVISDRYAHY